MKKALLVASILSVAAAAHAQSSVTLYGRVDTGIEYISGLPNATYTGSTSRWRAESGNWGGSFWGMKGAEDIGGGNKVVFQLEGAFNAMNGQAAGNTMFYDVGTVGLSNDKYGTFLLGREAFISNGLWDFDPFGQTAWSSASLVRGRNWQKSSNNISYQSPKFGGFDVYGQYSLSNATSWNGNNTTPQGRQDGLQITYTAPLFQVRGIYDEIRDPKNGLLNDPFSHSREYFAGLNVFLGPVTLRAAYQANRTSGGAATGNGPTSLDLEWAGANWQVTPAAALIAAAYHVNGNKGAGNATIYSIGGTYNLSKRTLLDLQIATVRNSAKANFGLDANAAGAGGVQADGSYNENPLPGHSQTGAYIGIQHYF
ncbi:gram-negative porin family protein [Burkholderia pseudomallei MSHR2990]|uniref:porin n=1 Tax=Burkholderia pseudomallei TaxID=28450 RepID=UPI000538A442|nr:porin [Burkholderia pseudomallei]KGW78428.1 gram-negative porin family protein [Burkholderia pseudomallei MSHR2990]